ncbi:MAG: GNAT family N-acetyltransferase [Leptolyngbyaceae cyanobacterium]
MVDLKRVGVESAEILVHLWRETFTQAYGEVHSAENIHAYCDRNYTPAKAIALLSDPQVHCCTAFRQGKPVGYCIVNPHPCPIPLEGDAAELKQIYILASEYGQGLGKTLFDQAVEIARDAHCTWLWLCVSDLNYRAQAFYRKLDFKPIGSGPVLTVGTDRLPSTILIRKL